MERIIEPELMEDMAQAKAYSEADFETQHSKIIELIDQNNVISIPNIRSAITEGNKVKVTNLTKNETCDTEHRMTPHQIGMVLAGSLINLISHKKFS